MNALYIRRLACVLVAVYFALPAHAEPVITVDFISTELRDLGWNVTLSATNQSQAVAVKEEAIGDQTVKAVVDFAIAEVDGEKAVAFNANPPSSSVMFQNAIQAITASLLQAEDGKQHEGGRKLQATWQNSKCDRRCRIRTCSYKEKVVFNIGCMALGSINPGWGYQVRYRTGRYGGSATARYPCNSPTWYADYRGSIAVCPLCETSRTFTMLDCRWP